MSFNTVHFPDPPTKDSLASARLTLSATRVSASQLSSKISAAEAALAQLIRDSQRAIEEMQHAHQALLDQIFRTEAYLSGIRRLPLELLREIFMWCFDSTGYEASAWTISSVCTSWRTLALSMPLIWSKIRLITTPQSSADTIRLWLERSGSSVPLDIEIHLRVASPKSTTSSSSSDASNLSRPPRVPSPTLPPYPHTSHYVVPHHPPGGTVTILAPGNVPPPIIMPLSPTPPHTPSSSHSSIGDSGCHSERNERQRPGMHWGHIAFFYLVEQMHRWERFVFRFDKQFASLSALKGINGDAPLLKEFEVTSAEAAFYTEWPWLPNTSGPIPSLPNLRTLTLQHAPFKWNSPMLRNLHVLILCAVPTLHIPLDRILYIIAQNPALTEVSLHFQGVLPAILPLTPLTLSGLKKLTIGGHYLLSSVVDALSLPVLQSLTIDVEARDPIEDTISALITRSHKPPIEHLSVAYNSSAQAFYYGPGGVVISWSLLHDLPALKTLQVGGTPLEGLVSALGDPDDDDNNHPPAVGGGAGNGWVCPNLEKLGMKACHAHSEGMGRLIRMVEARNPINSNGGGGGAPDRLKVLEMLECTSVGADIVQWLEGRVGAVVCTEPVYDRSLGNPYL